MWLADGPLSAQLLASPAVHVRASDGARPVNKECQLSPIDKVDEAAALGGIASL